MSISSYADIRSASLTKKRFRTHSQKYYANKYIKPGQLNKPHYSLLCPVTGQILILPPLPANCPVEIWDKQRLYQEAQGWPRPPRYHHRHVDKLSKEGASCKVSARRQRGIAWSEAVRSATNTDWTGGEDGKGSPDVWGTLSELYAQIDREWWEFYELEAEQEEREEGRRREAWEYLVDQAVEKWETTMDTEGWALVSNMYEGSEGDEQSDDGFLLVND